MNISLILVVAALLLVVGVVGYAVWSQFQNTPARSKPVRVAAADRYKVAAVERSPYRATSIRTGARACTAAKALSEQRFLVEARDIPVLPLAECDAAQCNCAYRQHGDRREEDVDRRALGGLMKSIREQSGGDERRALKRGRREDDQ